MLVLTRKTDQELVIGDQRITVRVLDVRGNRVRLGIVAPSDVSIRRADLAPQSVTTRIANSP